MVVLFKLIATTFSGGYRFLLVNAIAFICSSSMSDKFSVIYFLVGFNTSIIGAAIASQSYNLSVAIKLLHRVGLTLLMAIIISLSYVPFYGSEVYYLVVFSTLGFSLFEISRAQLVANGRYREIAINGIFFITLMPTGVFLLKANFDLLVLFSFGLTSLLVLTIYFDDDLEASMQLADVTNIFTYSISNGMSSGVNYLFPLLLVFFGASASTVAQVFSIAMLLAFLPRYWSLSYIHKTRSNGVNRKAEFLFFTRVIAFSAFIILAFLFLANLFELEAMKFKWLFIALIISQAGLPYANTLMVYGKGAWLLKANTYSLLLSGVACSLLLVLDVEFINQTTLLFFGYVVLRVVLTRYYSWRLNA